MSDYAQRRLAGRGEKNGSRWVARAAVISVTLSLGACAQGNDIDLGFNSAKPQAVDIATASTGPAGRAELEKATAYWAKRSAENPRDGEAALAYARNLKAMGRKKMAFSVLQGAYMFNSSNREFLSEYGRLALEFGQISTAAGLLQRAEDPAKPDWRLISAQGTVLAKQGRYKDAIEYYERARSLAPGQTSVLNNLAMAYTMTGEAKRGEMILRDAASKGGNDDRVRQNLALVLELQGRKDEARKVASGEAPVAGYGATPAAFQSQPAAASLTTASARLPLKPTQAAFGGTVTKTALAPAKSADDSGAFDADAIIRQALRADMERRRAQ